MFNRVAPYRYLLPNLYLTVADIANPDLFACGSRTWLVSISPAFTLLSGALPAIQRVRMAGLPKKTVIGPPPVMRLHNLHRVCQNAVTAPLRVGCVVKSLDPSHSLHRTTFGGKYDGFTLVRMSFIDFRRLLSGMWPIRE